ncbi:hypothetical protein WMY93_031112 [Mugilogobius chulae]|uniref:Uncharacterized protein n=1 Tax=Mugilogobius chulae TaxID=88201 RepID=A0AAW0MJ28_9GOBI
MSTNVTFSSENFTDKRDFENCDLSVVHGAYSDCPEQNWEQGGFAQQPPVMPRVLDQTETVDQYKNFPEVVKSASHINVLTSPTVANARRKALTVVKCAKKRRQVRPCLGLRHPWRNSGWKSRVYKPSLGKLCRDTRKANVNWELGVESYTYKRWSATYFCMKYVNWARRTQFYMPPLVNETVSYRTVNLSAPPRNLGFRHVELLMRADFAVVELRCNLLLNCRNFAFLGRVATSVDVGDLMITKVTAFDKHMLEDILDMHTALQVHPFVSRTFALQHFTSTKKSSYSPKCTGVFVGEKPGTVRLGDPEGFLLKSKLERCTLAFHVTQCLLQAQILMLRLLNTTLRCIQPARIWRHNKGFRLDFIGCLFDGMEMNTASVPRWTGTLGLATVHSTLKKLTLLDCMPMKVMRILNEISWNVFGERSHDILKPDLDCVDKGDDILYQVYNMCNFDNDIITHETALDVLLGDKRYTSFQLKTETSLAVDPYGPFYIRTNGKRFKWDKAIIVEPITDENHGLPETAQQFNIN